MENIKNVSCGACGDPNVIKGYYINHEKDITMRICNICAKTADINGFVKIAESDRQFD